MSLVRVCECVCVCVISVSVGVGVSVSVVGALVRVFLYIRIAV